MNSISNITNYFQSLLVLEDVPYQSSQEQPMSLRTNIENAYARAIASFIDSLKTAKNVIDSRYGIMQITMIISSLADNASLLYQKTPFPDAVGAVARVMDFTYALDAISLASELTSEQFWQQIVSKRHYLAAYYVSQFVCDIAIVLKWLVDYNVVALEAVSVTFGTLPVWGGVLALAPTGPLVSALWLTALVFYAIDISHEISSGRERGAQAFFDVAATSAQIGSLTLGFIPGTRTITGFLTSVAYLMGIVPIWIEASKRE